MSIPQTLQHMKRQFFPAWQEQAQQRDMIRTLWVVIGLLVVLNGLLFIGWQTAPTRLRLFIPPNIEQGAWLKADAIPPSTVYAFTYQIFTAVNTWTNGGEEDYKRNIAAYKNYFSDPFFRELLTDYTERAANGALMRHRVMAGVTGSGYTPSSVKSLGDGTWEVHLLLHLVETVDASVVKDVTLDYGFRVANINESIQLNPWGLQIVGFTQRAERLKTLI